MSAKIGDAGDGVFTDPVQLFHSLSGATRHAASQPKQRHSHEAQGRVLLLSRTGLVVVPFDMRPSGDWACVVVRGNATYPVGGHHLHVAAAEIETAVELPIESPAEQDPDV